MMKQHKTNLMKRMLKRAARARGQHGIALLFTLCILSMALIVAMIFSSISTTGRKVAAAYVDTSAAKILADGVVNRAILALMQSENASYVCSNYNTTKPNNGNENEYASDWIWKLEKPGLFSFNDGPLRFNRTPSQYYDLKDSRCPSWEYVFTKNAYGDSDANAERIYGRYAYVAIGQNDYLNPNAIGNREKVDDVAAFDKRLGRYTCEPQFIFKSTRNGWDYTKNPEISQKTIHDKYSGAGPNGWTDIDVFVNDLVGTGGSADTKQLKMMVDQYFDLSGAREYNKFRSDGKEISDLTKEPGSGESYRFPLIRNDWDSISVDTIRSEIPWFANADTSKANVEQTIANLINYNASERIPAVSRGNWYTDEVPFTGNKRTPYINEVQGEVSVGGHLGFPLKERYQPDPVNDPSNFKWRLWYTDCTYNHEITIRVETVNLYGANVIPVNNPPILIGEISYEYCTNAGGDNENASWRGGNTQSIRFDAGTQSQWEITSEPKGIYTVYTYTLTNNAVGSMTTPKRERDLGGSLYDRPMGHDVDFYQYIRIRNVKLSLDRVILQDTYGNADLALMPTTLQTGRTFTEESEVAGAGDFSKRFYFDTQVNDPRFNLARDQWSAPTFTGSDNVAELGNHNSAVKYNKNDANNYDPGEDPGSNKISTAYIPHKPMQSLWELGAIHRGAPWQTINLKCASKNGTGMGAYQDGDGHLLDQVALTTQDRVRDPVLGLINLNCVASFGGSSAPFAFKSLFTNFPIYKTYAAMYSGSADGTIKGDSVDSDKTGDMDADAYAKDLSEAVTYAIKQGHLPRRTAVFPEKYGDSQMDKIVKRNVPDAEAEEVFCRVVNLLKWNRQPLKRATVLVLAQTIKDIGGAPLERVLPEKTLDLMRDSGFVPYKSGNTTSKLADVDESWLRSNYKSRPVALKNYDNFYDEITGETKIIVRLEWDESANDNKGAWKVTRKEYAE